MRWESETRLECYEQIVSLQGCVSCFLVCLDGQRMPASTIDATQASGPTRTEQATMGRHGNLTPLRPPHKQLTAIASSHSVHKLRQLLVCLSGEVEGGR